MPKPATPAQSEPVDWLLRATTLANGGQLDEAAAALARFHEDREATAASLFLSGMLAESSGQLTDAESGYRKALYLEPNHLDALLHLSLLLENAGRASSAALLRRRIERLST
jgi:chemotaxis protein methyltransferase WspC